MNVRNLDRLCAQYGYLMCRALSDAFRDRNGKVDGSRVENHLTKSLGILQEEGIYAFFLYQVSRGEREGAEGLKEKARELLKAVSIKPFDEIEDPLEAVREADNLDDLLLAKRLLEQALIYARYHAKALEE